MRPRTISGLLSAKKSKKFAEVFGTGRSGVGLYIGRIRGVYTSPLGTAVDMIDNRGRPMFVGDVKRQVNLPVK